MNVKLNQKISEIEDVQNLYLMPSCGDESNPIGACYYNSSLLGETTKPLKSLYLGLSFDNNEIQKFIRTNDIEKKYLDK